MLTIRKNALRYYFITYIFNINVVIISSYVEPLSLEGFIFGPYCVLDFNGWYVFTATWPHFAVSEADQLIKKVGDVALNPNVSIYQHCHWRQFSVCGFPDFSAFFILDPTSVVVDGITCTVAMPCTVHLRSYLRQSDAEHPTNIILMMIVEDSDSRAPPRYRGVNAASTGKYWYPPPPGTKIFSA